MFALYGNFNCRILALQSRGDLQVIWDMWKNVNNKNYKFPAWL